MCSSWRSSRGGRRRPLLRDSLGADIRPPLGLGEAPSTDPGHELPALSASAQASAAEPVGSVAPVAAPVGAEAPDVVLADLGVAGAPCVVKHVPLPAVRSRPPSRTSHRGHRRGRSASRHQEQTSWRSHLGEIRQSGNFEKRET